MAGRFWQPNHEPPYKKGKQAPITLSKQWKEGGKGWGKLPGQLAATMLQVHTQSIGKNTSKKVHIHVHVQKNH